MRITIHRTGEYCIQYIDDIFDVGNHIMENDEKLDSEFRFALDLSEREREQSSTLNTGFDEATATWRVIVRYYGDLYEVERQLPGVQVIPLYHQYGIVRVPQEQLEALAAIPQMLEIPLQPVSVRAGILPTFLAASISTSSVAARFC